MLSAEALPKAALTRERNRLTPQPHLTYFSPPETSRNFTPHPHTTMTQTRDDKHALPNGAHLWAANHLRFQ